MIYDFKSLKLKRTIQITTLLGISKNTDIASNEFILHIKNDKNILFASHDRKDIIQKIIDNYKLINGIDLEVIVV